MLFYFLQSLKLTSSLLADLKMVLVHLLLSFFVETFIAPCLVILISARTPITNKGEKINEYLFILLRILSKIILEHIIR